jgi:Fe-S cluster assembly iron-binding protein IscA
MLTVTKRAVDVLKSAKAEQGAAPEAGIRILERVIPSNSGRALTVDFAITEDPAPDDEKLEQDGLRIFLQDTLIEPLDGYTLDVREDADEGPELVFR